jgi:cytochrome c oxidase subunit II
MNSEKTRGDIIKIAVIWVIASAAVEAVTAYFAGSYSGDASTQGKVTSEAIFFLLWVTIPIFVLVTLVIFYSMLRFRVADDDATPSESQYRSGRAFPWGWVAMSVVLNVLFIIHPGLTGLTAIWSMAEAATDPMEVDVSAAQWQWRFAYPGQDLTNVADLVVPIDTPIRFVLRSKDVIHSFWVPAWGIKKAVIPGETRTLVVTPDRLVDTAEDPTARLQCSQICGVGHAEMQSIVRVVSRADFDQWVATTRAAASEGGMNMPGMDMPGMDMPGMKMDMPGMGTEENEMPGMEMPSEAPMDHDMSGMQMPEQPPADQDMSGTTMPGMEMPSTETPGTEIPGMKMPGMEMPADDEAPMDMPMDEQMPMNDNMPSESPN